MKKTVLPALAAMILAASCAQNPDSGVIVNHRSFNGYTNHWQNEHDISYRYGNLFKINNCDIDKTIRAKMLSLADDLGLPGLQMQEGFLNGVIGSDLRELVNPSEEELRGAVAAGGKVIVYADRGSDVGASLARKAPEAAANDEDYQTKAADRRALDAFVKGDVFAVVGEPDAVEILRQRINCAREVLASYDLKRGWFGVQTHCQSVTCTQGSQPEVIGRGMNEGNSWFVFSGPYEFMSQPATHRIVDELGNPVVVDHGIDPLFGADDYSSLQVQLMRKRSDWLEFRKEHGGYMIGGMPENTILPKDETVDIYSAHAGIVKALNRCDRPFVVSTGELLWGTSSCMVLFTPKGGGFNREAMWKAIMSRRAVASVGGSVLAGPDSLRHTLELLAIDRTFIGDYFCDNANMEARIDGHKLTVSVENAGKAGMNGTLSLVLPGQIGADRLQQAVNVRPGRRAEISFELNPTAAATDRMNAILARFEWNGSVKSIMVPFYLPPAISAHQLLYGTESGCAFPVAIHNISGNSSVDVRVAVLDKEGNEVRSESKTVEVEKGRHADTFFNLTLPAGAYTVRTEAMGTEAFTQLGIGADSGEVTLAEVDMNGDGVNEYIMENSRVKVALLTTGARIIEYCAKGVDDNLFFKLWPEQPCDVNRSNRDHGFWPFGGFEDFLGQASVETHKVYDAGIVRNDGKCAEVRMSADYYGNKLEKIFTLYGDSPLVGIRFAISFVNPEMNIIGPQPILVLGKSHGVEDKFIIPELDGVNTYVMDPVNMYGRIMHLKEGWNAGYDTIEDLHYVGAYPVGRPYYLHMWMNLEQNGESHYPYAELQPWVPIQTGTTSFFSYYMWADGGSWEKGLQELRDRNLITAR